MRKYIIAIVAFFGFFCISTKVDAILCTSKLYRNLKSLAYQTEVSYELHFDSNHDAYFTLKVANVDKNVLVGFGGELYEPENGTVELNNRLEGGITYEVQLYGGYDTECVEEHLYTKKLTVPKYNKYSERDECIEYEEFYMCNKWYPNDIQDDEEFETALNEYIQSLNKKEKEEKVEVEKGFFEKIIDFYTDNIMITLPITIGLGLFAIYKVIVIIIRRKNRVKIDI